MLSHDEMVSLQAECHDVISVDKLLTREEYVLHLLHTKAYSVAAKLAKNKTVLDLGCNVGYGSYIVGKYSKNIIGADVSKKAIALANEKYENSRIQFVLVDGKTLPFDDNSFDLVVSFQVIEHIVNHDIYFSEIKRILKIDGVSMFTTPNGSIRLNPGMRPWNPFHAQEFGPKELNFLLMKYYDEFEIFGLFAEKPIYTIEYNRVKSNLESALKKKKLLEIFRGFIKSLLTPKMISYVQKAINRKVHEQNNSEIHGMMGDYVKKYTLDKVYYRNNNLEHALDFLAICSDNQETQYTDKIIKI